MGAASSTLTAQATPLARFGPIDPISGFPPRRRSRRRITGAEHRRQAGVA
jgi:hypothetical protein